MVTVIAESSALQVSLLLNIGSICYKYNNTVHKSTSRKKWFLLCLCN